MSFQAWSLWFFDGQAIQPFFENGLDAPVRVGLKVGRSRAGCLKALRLVTAGKTHEPKTGAVTLLGMTPGFQDPLDELRGPGSNAPGPADKPSRRPFQMCAVGGRHVFRISRILACTVTADMAGHPPPLVKHLLTSTCSRTS